MKRYLLFSLNLTFLKESESGVENFIPPSTFDNKYSWNYVENGKLKLKQRLSCYNRAKAKRAKI